MTFESLVSENVNLKSRLSELEERVTSLPYAHLVEELDKIPGIDKILAMAIIAEASTDMSAFADERKFAACAGVASGNNESAGKKKDLGAVTVTHI